MRLRLYDFRISRGPRILGICAENQPACAEFCNSAQRRLILAREAGDAGWWGSFAEVAINGVSRTNPYITMPREVARIEAINVCDSPVPMNNQYFEYLEFGNGRMPQVCCNHDQFRSFSSSYTRNNAITFIDPTIKPFTIRVFATDPADIQAAKRVLIQGTDTSDSVIYSQDGTEEVRGVFVTLDTPFSDTPLQFNSINGIQKDLTSGAIQIFQVDPATGTQTLLLTMEPTEQTAGYRRYYLGNIPCNCCQTPSTSVQNLRVTAIVKLELVPVMVDTDYLMLTNLEAIIEECISIRMSEMDNPQAQQLAAIHHINAIRYLNSELSHYMGKQSPAVNFAPFGSAKLERINIGML